MTYSLRAASGSAYVRFTMATRRWELERGVWEAPYRVGGVRVLIAIDRNGNARKHVKLTANTDPARAADWLRGLLDRIDPVPELRLVKPAAPAPTIDPDLYNDPRNPAMKRRHQDYLIRRAAEALSRHRLR